MLPMNLDNCQEFRNSFPRNEYCQKLNYLISIQVMNEFCMSKIQSWYLGTCSLFILYFLIVFYILCRLIQFVFRENLSMFCYKLLPVSCITSSFLCDAIKQSSSLASSAVIMVFIFYYFLLILFQNVLLTVFNFLS